MLGCNFTVVLGHLDFSTINAAWLTRGLKKNVKFIKLCLISIISFLS